MNDIILEKILDFDIADYQPIHPRSLDLGEPFLPRKGNLVKVVTGMRRSGKSYRLFQEMQRIHAQGVGWNRMCYFDFEDDRLVPVTPETGDEVLETFLSQNPNALDEGIYLFFDELQEMDGWGSWMRRVVDTYRATIYVSGSSSKMLSDEIATEFRGRALDFELLPYSFAEYAQVLEPGIDTSARGHSTRQRLQLTSLFKRYLEDGGFPAALALPRAQAVSLLQSYVQRVVTRDVVERHDVSRPRVASVFAQRVLGCNAREISLRKIEGDLRSMGLSTSRGLLGDLLGYFGEAYLAFTVREFSRELSEGSRTSPKVYSIDPGLALANARANTNDVGQRLENAVYLELRRRMAVSRPEGISSLRTQVHGFEVDFVVGDAVFQDVTALYQVSVSVEDPKTLERETRALWEALDEKNLDEGTLIVMDGPEKTFENGGRRIVQIPAWRWFLGQA